MVHLCFVIFDFFACDFVACRPFFLHRVPRFFATSDVKVGLAADPKSWFQNPITLCSPKSDVFDDGLDGFVAE